MSKQMREICRGKAVDNSEWIEGYLLVCGITKKHFILPTENVIKVTESNEVGRADCLKLFAFEVIPETVGWCLGLPDRNKKMIFEGDIIVDILDGGERGYVVYDSLEAEYGTAYDEYVVLGLGGCNTRERIEVIGNIHDNHELLEAKK